MTQLFIILSLLLYFPLAAMEKDNESSIEILALEVKKPFSSKILKTLKCYKNCLGIRKEQVPTPIELLIDICYIQLEKEIQELKKSQNNEDLKGAQFHSNYIFKLDHIRVDYRSSILGIFYNKKKYIQLEESSHNGWYNGDPKIKQYAPNKTLIEKLNKQIISCITIKTSLKKSNDKSKLFTAHINLKPLQNFFFDHLPWHNKHPILFAGTVGILCTGITWKIMSKK